jgi:16S rRNA (guanine527-N7)-methyltransferase
MTRALPEPPAATEAAGAAAAGSDAVASSGAGNSANVAAQGLVAALAAGADALGLALGAEPATKLLQYLDLLKRWNAVFNLTAVRAPADMLRQHLLDCLAVLPALDAHVEAQAAAASARRASAPRAHTVRVLDVGSGGGLPGVVLAIMRPQWEVVCIDTVAKKASFIRQVAGELQLPGLEGVHARVERYQAPEGFQVITSRAFASLADFTALTRHLLAPAGVWMAMKGNLPEEEQGALPAAVEVFHVEQLQVPGLDARRCLVWLRPAVAVSQPGG